MSEKKRNLKVGDSVIVKPGVKDPDTGGDIGGWQGRVSGFDKYNRGPLRSGDRVNVKGVSLVDDHYGIIVELRVGRRRYDFPLCDLEVADQRSANYQPVKDYAIWFANR